MKTITMKICKALALAILFAPACSMGGFNYNGTFLDDDISYEFESGSTTQVYVSGLKNSSATSITIPATVVYKYVDYYDYDDDGNYATKQRTCSVTSIYKWAFDGKTSLKSVTIENGLTSIGEYAFQNCTSLASVTIPSSVTSIGQYAFYDCAALPTADIPESVTSVGNYAFGNCRKLSGVTIPSGVGTLHTTAFDGCDILWTEWYRTLADFAVNGRAYDLTQTPGDRAIAEVIVNGDTALDDFVLIDGKVYDSVLYINNISSSAVKLTLPDGYTYKAFKSAAPLTIPAYSQNILTITRVAAGSSGGDVFLVTREELATIQ